MGIFQIFKEKYGNMINDGKTEYIEERASISV